MGRSRGALGLLCLGALLFTLILTGCEDTVGSAADGPLGPPHNLTADVHKEGFTVLLFWNMDTGQTYDGFVIERDTGIGSFEEIGTVGKTNLGYGDETDLEAGTYHYRVGAVREGLETCYCESVKVIVLEAPDWIQGSWADQADSSFTYTFFANNVVWGYSGPTIDFNEYNLSYADVGAYFEDNVVDADSYELLWYKFGILETTYSFDQVDASSLTYTDGTSTLTLVK